MISSVRAATQWVPRRTMTEAWRRKQDHYAREVRDRQGEKETLREREWTERESARAHTHTHCRARPHAELF